MTDVLTPIYSSPRKINNDADKALTDSLHAAFPIENKNYYITVDNIKAHRKDYSHMSHRPIYEPYSYWPPSCHGTKSDSVP